MELEVLEKLLHLLNDLEPVGVLGLVAAAIFVWVWRNPVKPIQKSMDELKDNHLHDLPRMADSLDKVVDVLQRIEVKMAESFAEIKVKIDEK